MLNANLAAMATLPPSTTQASGTDAAPLESSDTSFNQVLKNEIKNQESVKTAQPKAESSKPTVSNAEANKKTDSADNASETDQEQPIVQSLPPSLAALIQEVVTVANTAPSADKSIKTEDEPTDSPDPLVVTAPDVAVAGMADIALISTTQPARETTHVGKAADVTIKTPVKTPVATTLPAIENAVDKSTVQTSNVLSTYIVNTNSTNKEAPGKFDNVLASAAKEHTTAETKIDTVIPVPKTVTPDSVIVNSSLPVTNRKEIPQGLQGLSESQLNAIAPILTAPSVHEPITNSVQTIAARVGTPDWNEAIGQKMNWMVTGAQQSASLTLNPPELGPLQVHININHQQADATFISHQPEVRSALENAIPKLREMMEQSGIQLGQCNVNSQARPQQEFVQRQAGSSHSNTSLNSIGNVADLNKTQADITRRGNGMVDTFV